MSMAAEKYYMEAFLRGTPWPSGGIEEQEISKYDWWSLNYAFNVIQGPWKLGEAQISTDSYLSHWYARDAVRGRWELGENSISENFHHSGWYLFEVLQLP